MKRGTSSFCRLGILYGDGCRLGDDGRRRLDGTDSSTSKSEKRLFLPSRLRGGMTCAARWDEWLLFWITYISRSRSGSGSLPQFLV